MGQYHYPVNLDKKEYLHPHHLGDGLKLMEFGQSGFGTMTALSLLLAPEGRWHGDRIAIVGDYAEPNDIPGGPDASVIYSLCTEEKYRDEVIEWHEKNGHPIPTDWYTNVSDVATKILADLGWVTFTDSPGWKTGTVGVATPGGPEFVVANLDKRLTLTPNRFGDGPTLPEFGTDYWGGTMTALAILLGCSSREGGRGGGDFHLDQEGIVGSWAGDRLAIVENDDFVDVSDVLRKLIAEAGEGEYKESEDGTIERVRW